MTPLNDILGKLKQYLPTQNPLKDFVQYNLLQGFQDKKFHEALQIASQTFGYQVYLNLDEYRRLYNNKEIDDDILDKIIIEHKNTEELSTWKKKLLFENYNEILQQNIGNLKQQWKEYYSLNPDKTVYPTLFRILNNFLDQGVAAHKFPYTHLSFLEAIKSLEKNSVISIFKNPRPKKLLFEENNLLEKLLEIVVGNPIWFEHYLFDQQFAHPGWSGMVALIENQPQLLVDIRFISLEDLICFELLLEIDALDSKYGTVWKPIAHALKTNLKNEVFEEFKYSELFEIYKIWQEAYEWNFYDKVLKALQTAPTSKLENTKTFQALFCIDDRECSTRRHIEKCDPNCETFGTPGFFNVPFYYQAMESKVYTKVCPAPIHPNHLIIEKHCEKRYKKDKYLDKKQKGLIKEILFSSFLGISSAIDLSWSIFFPKSTPMSVSSFKHMDEKSKLTIDYEGEFNGLKIGFTIEEMTDKIEKLLSSIGLTKNFAPIIYLIGHGASSTNNTHYAAYDCGACGCKVGSANARVAAYMANKSEVKLALAQKGIFIPHETQFLGGLHDTTRDEVVFYDEEILNPINQSIHKSNKKVFHKALTENAVERSQRFLLVEKNLSHKMIYNKMKLRSLSLFEPRSEWDHATNTLCIIAKRDSTKKVFLDRRAFLNSYDYQNDTDGTILQTILNAVTPVCGGINLEYYFSKTDNHKLGAGSKLPHNVMGLIGVSNGMEGDLRTGLSMQMINIHEPKRLLMIIEQYPEIVLKAIQSNPKTYQWYANEWINLATIHPLTKDIYVFKKEEFINYYPNAQTPKVLQNILKDIDYQKKHSNIYHLA
ncbi:MAG: hypothetical protein RLZZ414_2163 [Bacteroidota bacterium]|jgi:uncharacterized protein YbcC (UPF0753/DUF2309 family)